VKDNIQRDGVEVNMKWLVIEENLGMKAGRTERQIFEMPAENFAALQCLTELIDHMEDWLDAVKTADPALTHTVELRILLSLSERRPSKVCLQAASSNHLTTQKPERAGQPSSSVCDQFSPEKANQGRAAK
jgi:hypothetical protein